MILSLFIIPRSVPILRLLTYEYFKGIGLAIVRQLALQYPKSALNNGPFLIYLTSRDQGRGQSALKDLQADKQLKAAKALISDGGLADIKYAQLDISNTKSIDDFATFLKKEHGEIDFYIGNAGIAMSGFGRLLLLVKKN